MSSPVDTIKQRLSIVDVISSYLTLENSGKSYRARCPFHNEKTPSFFVSPDRGSYYCFGCSAKGDIFSFVEHFEGTDFLGALKLLAERAGVPLEYGGRRENRDDKERSIEIMEEATNFFESSFKSSPEARAYLLERGLTDATIDAFRIGYAPNAWRSVSDHLIKKGFNQNDLEIVGLMKKTEKGAYDRFRGRIMFPISDSSGRVIAFSGRIFGRPDDEEAKYLNSPDTPLFNKSNVLFGIDKAKLAIRTRGYSIIVEGQMDLLLSHQAGFTNTVAVSGTALADTTSTGESKINNLGLVKRLSPNVIFAYDGDGAGIRAASRSAMIALSLDMQVKIAVLPERKDPADIIRENPDTWKDIVKTSVNIVSFHIDRICQSTTDTRIRGRKIREVVFPFLVMVRSAIERSAYMTEINSKTGISEKALIEDFENYEKSVPKINQETSSEKIEAPKNVVSRKESLEKKLCGILFWKKDTTDLVDTKRELTERIGEEALIEIIARYEPFADALAFEAEMWYGSKNDTLARDIKELMLNLEEEVLEQQKMVLRDNLNTEESLSIFNNLSKRIDEIKQRRSQ